MGYTTTIRSKRQRIVTALGEAIGLNLVQAGIGGDHH